MENRSAAMTFSRVISPVLPVVVSPLQLTPVRYALPVLTVSSISPSQFTAFTVTVPVVTVRSSDPTAALSIRISPVLRKIAALPETEARHSTLPVLATISMLSKPKAFGISMLPVLSSIKSPAYSLSGRYTVIFGSKGVMPA